MKVDYKVLTILLKFRLKYNIVNHINMIISSDSMFPTLKRGDIVYVKPKRDLEIGDIIAYTHCHENITVHRIFAIKNNKIITKGDNNPFVDEYIIGYDDVIGIVYKQS